MLHAILGCENPLGLGLDGTDVLTRNRKRHFASRDDHFFGGFAAIGRTREVGFGWKWKG
jgi:hypothetical protein